MARTRVAFHPGDAFGRLTVLAEGATRSNSIQWKCRCACGTVAYFTKSNLVSGRTQSCGCLHREIVSTHRSSNTPEWRAWRDMLGRCRNPTHALYRLYGARGITFHREWAEFSKFFAVVGPRPDRHHSLERIDNGGNYEPGNVMWASRIAQANNTRRNVRHAFGGCTKTVAQWAREYGMKEGRLRWRLDHGWTMERALGV